jgi:hypothetical protein
MSNKTRHITFIAFAILAFTALVYHAVAIYHPETPAPLINLVAAIRHAFFILVNIVCIYGILKRPKWFIWFVAALTLQQWYSHGSYAIELWQKQHIIHWISVADILLLPVLLILLRADKKIKQA